MTSDSRCAAGNGCIAFDRREGLAELLDGHPVLCELDLVASERAVPLLVRDYADLERQYLPSSSRGDGQPRGSTEPPSLIPVDVEALQRKIWFVLTAWEEALRDRAKLSDPEPRWYAHWSAPDPRLKPGVEVQRAARIIEPRIRLLASVGLTTMVGYPDLDDEQAFRLGAIEYAELPGWRGVVDFRRLHGQALAAQGLTDAKPEHCEGVPCRLCDLKALYREPAEDGVRCGACGHRMTAEEYAKWTRLLAAQARQDTPESSSLSA